MTKKSKLTLIELIFATDLVKGNNSKDKRSKVLTIPLIFTILEFLSDLTCFMYYLRPV